MKYLTYDEYKQAGGTLDSSAFNAAIIRVCGIIDAATFERVKAMQSVPEEVKALCQSLIEYLTWNSTNTKALTGKSQSAGGVSESESYSVKSNEDISRDIDNMLCDYLLTVKDDKGTPLLYRSVRV